MVTIEKRETAISELYKVILTLFFVNALNLLYSLILLMVDASACSVNSAGLWNLTSLIRNAIVAILWMYPLMVYIWPGSKACWICGKKNQAIERKESAVAA